MEDCHRVRGKRLKRNNVPQVGAPEASIVFNCLTPRLSLQGYLVLISTRMSEIGEEQFSSRFFKGGMTDVSYSPELRQAVAAGPTSIKVGTRGGSSFGQCAQLFPTLP